MPRRYCLGHQSDGEQRDYANGNRLANQTGQAGPRQGRGRKLRGSASCARPKDTRMRALA